MRVPQEFPLMVSLFSAMMWDGKPEVMTYDEDQYTASLLMEDGNTIAIFPIEREDGGFSLVYRIITP